MTVAMALFLAAFSFGAPPQDVAVYSIDDPALHDFMRQEAASGAWKGPVAPGRTSAQAVDILIEKNAYLANKRVPPQGFERCFSSGPGEVRLEFTVMPGGRPGEIAVVDSRNSCYDEYAVRSLRKWRFHPPVIGGEPAMIEGVETVFRFAVSG